MKPHSTKTTPTTSTGKMRTQANNKRKKMSTRNCFNSRKALLGAKRPLDTPEIIHSEVLSLKFPQCKTNWFSNQHVFHPYSFQSRASCAQSFHPGDCWLSLGANHKILDREILQPEASRSECSTARSRLDLNIFPTSQQHWAAACGILDTQEVWER